MNKKNIFNFIKYGFIVFIVISILSYFYEEFIFWVFKEKFVKRGFLYGPWLPIYGWGSLLILLTCSKLKKHPILIFIVTFILTGFLEGTSGFIIDKFFHKRLWNYSKDFLNIGGYVCLKSAIGFAIGGLLLIYIIEPFIKYFYNKLSNKQTTIISIFLFIIFVTDNIFSHIFK